MSYLLKPKVILSAVVVGLAITAAFDPELVNKSLNSWATLLIDGLVQCADWLYDINEAVTIPTAAFIVRRTANLLQQVLKSLTKLESLTDKAVEVASNPDPTGATAGNIINATTTGHTVVDFQEFFRRVVVNHQTLIENLHTMDVSHTVQQPIMWLYHVTSSLRYALDMALLGQWLFHRMVHFVIGDYFAMLLMAYANIVGFTLVTRLVCYVGAFLAWILRLSWRLLAG